MSEQVSVAQPAHNLYDIEKLIGLQFFAQPNIDALARSNATELPAETQAQYGPLYISGLRLLAAARRQFGIDPNQLTREHRDEIRGQYAEEIAAIRERIRELAPVVTPAPEGALTKGELHTELRLGRVLFEELMAKAEPIFIVSKRSRSSRWGALLLTADEAAPVRAEYDALEKMADDDVLVTDLRKELQTGLVGFASAAADAGVVPKPKLKGGGMQQAVSATEAAAIRAYYRQREDTTGLTSLTDIAARTNTPLPSVHEQVAWRGFGEFVARRNVRHGDIGKVIRAYFLPDELAQQIIHDLEIIVPDEYLTIGEYARLRGADESHVRYVVNTRSLPVHKIGTRDPVAYLDGDTIYQLDQIIQPRGRAPADWHSAQELMAMFDISPPTFYQQLTGEFANVAQPMKPHEGDGQTVPHYPPTLTAHLRKVIKPKGPLPGRTSLADLKAETGMSDQGLLAFLEREGVDMQQARTEGGQIENYYLDTDFAAVRHKLPRRFLPVGGVSVELAAQANGITIGGMRSRINRREVPIAGRFLQGSRGAANFYWQSDLAAAGFRVPSMPAFPAGERVFGRYGPHRQQSRIPPYLQPLQWLLMKLPDAERPTPQDAQLFLQAHGGTLQGIGGRLYVWGVSAGLLNYNFGRRGCRPQRLADGWLNRLELAAVTGQEAPQVDRDLEDLDWNSARPYLERIPTNSTEANTPRSRASVHVLWSQPRDGGPVILPHYNPAVVARLIGVAHRRQKATET